MTNPNTADGARVVVVTGGSKGLGLAMAQAFAAAGDHVVVASRKIDECVSVCTELERLGASQSLAVQCHVGSWQDCDALIETTLETFGRIDVLVNNAGMSPLYDDLESLSSELFDKVIAVNMKGPLRLAVKAAAAMERGDGGSIINISSVAAVQPQAYDLPYAMAKAGLNTMTAGLAKALAPKVRVNAVLAGPFATTVASAWNEDTVRRVAKQTAMGRVGRPEEIVAAVLYLAGRGASYTTGAMLKVDGGMAW